jgi:glycosyltransferase-like protein
MKSLRIALLAHSTNPRGGVVHTLEVAEALTRLGHEAVVHAPDASGAGFFRKTLCRVAPFPVGLAGADVVKMVATRIEDYLQYFEPASRRSFDVYHAEDGISGNALATLKKRGLISSFARTVHHIENFVDKRLAVLQARSIAEADALFVVSETWRDVLNRSFGRQATIVGNGVDCARFSPTPDGRESGLRRRFGLGHGLIFVAVGGVEERKNSIRILEAFAQVRHVRPDARLIIAGGASLLDHASYQQDFTRRRNELDLNSEAVVITGPLAQDDLPALYRLADALVFPSKTEGFGLVVLEAMASGLPTVVSKIPPFTEYISDGDVAWCDPYNVATIASAMLVAATTPARDQFVKRGRFLAARRDWRQVAAAHIADYVKIRELVHA